MNSLKSLKLLFQDTYNKCFGFLNSKDSKLYEQVETNQAKNVEEEEQTEKGSDWSTQESIAQSQGSLGDKNDTPPKKEKKKTVLIGNVDEDSVIKKQEADMGLDEDLFQDMEKPSFNQKIQAVTKNVKKTAKPQAQEAKTNKFSMDDELQAEGGWGEMEANI